MSPAAGVKAGEALAGFALELAGAGTLCQLLVHFPSQLPAMTCANWRGEENCTQAK